MTLCELDAPTPGFDVIEPSTLRWGVLHHPSMLQAPAGAGSGWPTPGRCHSLGSAPVGGPVFFRLNQGAADAASGADEHGDNDNDNGDDNDNDNDTDNDNDNGDGDDDGDDDGALAGPFFFGAAEPCALCRV